VRKKIGRVFQDLKIIQDRTAWENLMLAFQILGKSEKEVKSEAEQIFSLVGLEERMNLFPSQLSEGEKQRLGIARALVGEPEILLIDEPTSNLDPANTWQIMKLLDEINKKGIAVFLATHDEDLVDSLQKRVIEIGQGKLLRDEKKGGYSAK
jgi:cell division transport system ATP-binding protein